MSDLIASALSGDVRSIGRLISTVERLDESARQVLSELVSVHGKAHVVGLTGAPGVGKSTTTSALITHYRALDLRVAVLAIDPSSPFSGGALLGDRIRMQSHALDDKVFIRSMAARGQLGGLSVATGFAVRILDACGFDVILIETVGVGQSEIDIVAAADTTVVVTAPGMGDSIQAAKAGVLEIADVFVINKADRDGAANTERELRGLVESQERDWKIPVVATVATSAEGIAQLAEVIAGHYQHILSTGELVQRRIKRTSVQVELLVDLEIRNRMAAHKGLVTSQVELVAENRQDPFSAARIIVAGLLDSHDERTEQ